MECDGRLHIDTEEYLEPMHQEREDHAEISQDEWILAKSLTIPRDTVYRTSQGQTRTCVYRCCTAELLLVALGLPDGWAAAYVSNCPRCRKMERQYLAAIVVATMTLQSMQHNDAAYPESLGLQMQVDMIRKPSLQRELILQISTRRIYS